MASRKQYWAIKNSMTGQQKKVIEFYELQWVLRTKIPSPQEVADHLKLKLTEVNYFLTLKHVQKALEDRGIKWQVNAMDELTERQIAVAHVMMNFSDTRPNAEKLDDLGVLPSTYYSWQEDPQFKALLQTLADRNKVNIRPTAVAEFTKLINKGDWSAIKYYLDVTGEFRGNDAPASEQFIIMIIEILQDEIKDPVVITRIAKRLQAASLNKTLEIESPPQYAITGEVVDVESVSLADAKKALNL